ncbi:nucleotidyltransferase domain-containing protein [Pseudoduganella sp. SL102]|uniref:nucleotidyltransferase domain-containing protein n=1 Tax=Pseudoduganella sp. SL102 TaxID=2995154 RepID=UPI00248B841F|nr:nucleotidyltransferase domain-containing protein [Pseudoduganella sp. SL102]WBS02306.1 nucleotidyltransferase domain-containing protein [Pseudoduganella sp. SL102]
MLANFLLGPLRTRILSALLLHPDTAWHVRELARQLDALPGTINRELIRLEEVGILSKQRIGNQVHYRANRDCPVFAELAGLLRKTSGMATVLADALHPLADRIQCALVFGSVARGEETAHSDVDVLVFGDIGFADVVEVLHPAQEAVQREINPVVYRADDFRAKYAANNTWAHEVVNKPKLFLIGNGDDFAKLVGHPEPR